VPSGSNLCRPEQSIDRKTIEEITTPIVEAISSLRTPQQLATEVSSERPIIKPDRAWRNAAFDKLIAIGRVRVGMGKTDLAREFVSLMRTDPGVKPPSKTTERHDVGNVELWDYWPVTKAKLSKTWSDS
jgi:hypothetical protein